MSLFALSLQQFTDGAGRPASSVVRFYRSGTTQPVAVFKDPGFTSPHPVDIRSDSLGSIPPIHMKPDGIKLRAEITTNGTKTRALDDIDPGLETTDVTPSAMSLPNNPLTGAGITIAVDDFGTFVQIATATGEAIPVGMPRVTDVPDGRIVGVRNKGLGVAVLRPTSPDLIDNAKSIVIPANASVLVRATGASFESFAATPLPARRWLAKSRQLKAPPASSTAGDTYLAAADASGLWVPNKIYMANGSGGWSGYLPEVGDQVAVADETVQAGSGADLVKLPLLLTWTGEAWVPEYILAKAYANDAIAALIKPVDDRVKVLEDKAANPLMRVLSGGVSGTTSLAAQGGVQPTAGQWTRAKLTSNVGLITGASMANNIVTLPKGKYLVTARRKAKGAISVAVGFRSVSGSGSAVGMPVKLGTDTEGIAELNRAIVTVTAESETFELVFILAGTIDTLSTGVAAAITGVDEIYAEATIEKIA